MSLRHLYKRCNGFYYFRIRVPSDLILKFPAKTLIKSLKTKDHLTAKSLIRNWQHKTEKAFILLRSGFLSKEQELELISTLLHRKMHHEKKPILRLSDVIAEYAKEHDRNWMPKSRLEFEGCGRIIVDVMGDKEIRNINRLSVKNFRDKLLRLPPNLYKRNEFRGMTIDRILETEVIHPMSISTVNKHLAWLSSILKYCVREGYIPTNCAEGLQIKEDRRMDEQRKIYEKDDLQRIVDNLSWDGNHPERYWIPLVAMFTGMRINEICQLYVEDVKEFQGVWCFDINDNTPDKKLKNKSSRRVIPIHPILINLGFKKYVDRLRHCKTPRLWNALKWREADGYYNAFGKWSQRFNKAYISNDPGKVTYSIRHSFANTLKQKGIQESVIAELMGHTNPCITTGRYGKRYEIDKLLDALNMLDYGINFSALLPDHKHTHDCDEDHKLKHSARS